MTLTPILPVAPAPASATDPEPSGGDGARFQRTLTEASGRYRADGAGRSGRARPADARITGAKDRPADPGEDGTDPSAPTAAKAAAGPGPAAGRGVDGALLVQTAAVTVAPVPGPPSVALPVQAATGEPGVERQAADFSGRPSNALAGPGSPAASGSLVTPVAVPLGGTTASGTVAATAVTAATTATAASAATDITTSAGAGTMPVAPARPSGSGAGNSGDAIAPPPGASATATVAGAAPSSGATAPTTAPVDTGTPTSAAPDRSAAAIAAAALAGAGGNAPVAGVRTTRAATSVQAANGADSSAAPVTVDPAAGTGTVGSAHRPPDAGPAPDAPAGTTPDATSYPTAPAPGAGPATAASPSPAASTPGPGEPVTVPDQVLRHLESVRALRDGGHRTVLRLEPDHLGAVTVTVDVRGGAVRMAVAGGPQALAAVREGIAHLRTVLADAGLDLGDVALRAEALQPTSGSSSGTAASPDGQASPNGSRPDRGSDGADGAAGGERRPARQHEQGGPTAADRLDAVRPSAALHSPPAAGAAGDEPATTRRLDVRV